MSRDSHHRGSEDPAASGGRESDAPTEPTAVATAPAADDPTPPADRITVRIELPTATIVKAALAIVVFFALVTLRPLIYQLYFGLLLAAVLHPFVSWLERRGLSRGIATILVVVPLLGVLGVGVYLLLSPIVSSGGDLLDALPEYVDDLGTAFQNNPTLRNQLEAAASWLSTHVASIVGGAVGVGAGIIGAFATLFVVITLTAYLLLDGARVYAGLRPYIPGHYRSKVDRAIPLVIRAVSGYVLGQLILSISFGIFTFTVLTLLNVPYAAILAIMAALLVAIPNVGATLATIPATLLALTVSFQTAVIVLVLYVAYQQVENYVISPRIFQRTLNIPGLWVFLSVLTGTYLFGIFGVFIALPVAASVPVILRVWQEGTEPASGRDPTPLEMADISKD